MKHALLILIAAAMGVAVAAPPSFAAKSMLNNGNVINRVGGNNSDLQDFMGKTKRGMRTKSNGKFTAKEESRTASEASAEDHKVRRRGQPKGYKFRRSGKNSQSNLTTSDQLN